MLAEDSQQYARVGKRLGDGRFELTCLTDGQLRLGHVRGKLWKRVWINPSDLVLVALRGWQDQKVDIVHKFTHDEERLLLHQIRKDLPRTQLRSGALCSAEFLVEQESVQALMERVLRQALSEVVAEGGVVLPA